MGAEAGRREAEGRELVGRAAVEQHWCAPHHPRRFAVEPGRGMGEGIDTDLRIRVVGGAWPGVGGGEIWGEGT